MKEIMIGFPNGTNELELSVIVGEIDYNFEIYFVESKMKRFKEVIVRSDCSGKGVTEEALCNERDDAADSSEFNFEFDTDRTDLKFHISVSIRDSEKFAYIEAIRIKKSIK